MIQNAPTAAPAQTTPPPATCNVLGWVVFGPGAHKDGKDFYSPAMCERIPANFARLKGHTVPRAKIGHDQRQLVAERLKKSLGFLSVGDVTGVRPVAGFPGYVEIDVRNVPTRAVGGEIAAGRLNSGSVELIPGILDPDDPAERIEGPILTGVSFLGEEQPAVRNFPRELRARSVPRATFDDGTPVPPNGDVPPEWVDAMASAHRSLMSDLARPTVSVAGRDYAASVICFSDLSPLPPAGTKTMTPEIQAALDALRAAGMTPDQIVAALGPAVPPPATAMSNGGAMPQGVATMAGSTEIRGSNQDAQKRAMWAKDPDGDGSGSDGQYAAFAEQCKKYADDPAATPEQKMFAAFAKKFSDVEKRVGAAEAYASEVAKKDEAAQMAAFSAQVDEACKSIARKVEPAIVQKVVKPTALGILTSKSFSAESERVKAFSDYFAGFASLPDNPAFARVATSKEPGKAGVRALTPLQQRMARKGGLLDRESPRASAALRAAAAAAAA